jgi:hypothetical protein
VEYSAFDAHKKYTLASVEDRGGEDLAGGTGEPPAGNDPKRDPTPLWSGRESDFCITRAWFALTLVVVQSDSGEPSI